MIFQLTLEKPESWLIFGMAFAVNAYVKISVFGRDCKGNVKQGQLVVFNLAFDFKKRTAVEPTTHYRRKFEAEAASH